MSCIGLGQAAQVEKLICTSALELSGVLVTPNAISFASAASPFDFNLGTQTIAVGNANKVSVYGFNTTANTITFILNTATAGVRNHSFLVSYQANQLLGTAKTATYSIHPTSVSSFSLSTTFVFTFNGATILNGDSQRITVFILNDS